MENRQEIKAPGEYSLASARPPYREKGYKFFKKCELFSFSAHAKVFELVNAWYLCEASILSYESSGVIEEEFKALRGNGFGEGLLKLHWLNGVNTQAYCAEFQSLVVVAFRGTQSSGEWHEIAADCLTDANAILVDSEQGGMVHSGFKRALGYIWQPLLELLLEFHKSGKRLWFTGHSLGGALATLAADKFGDVAGLYTYGSPRVGDKSFRDDFFVPAYRFVNNNDIVPRVPPEVLGYEHVGLLKYIDCKGVIHENASHWSIFTDGLQGRVSHLVNGVGKLRLGFGSVIPDAVVDHIPELYSSHIWNSLPGIA